MLYSKDRTFTTLCWCLFLVMQYCNHFLCFSLSLIMFQKQAQGVFQFSSLQLQSIFIASHCRLIYHYFILIQFIHNRAIFLQRSQAACEALVLRTKKLYWDSSNNAAKAASYACFSEGEAFRARNHADRSLFHAAYTSDLPKGKLLPRNLKLATYNGWIHSTFTCRINEFLNRWLQ